jgi:hypothetical protein
MASATCSLRTRCVIRPDRRWCVRRAARGDRHAPTARAVASRFRAARAPAHRQGCTRAPRRPRVDCWRAPADPVCLACAPPSRVVRRPTEGSEGDALAISPGHLRAAPRHAGRCDRAAVRRSGRDRPATRSGVHRQVAAGSPRWPQGHGFIAATSWKRAGNSDCRAAREITMWPGLDRLAQHFQHSAVEFRKLVEKENTIVRKRDLPGSRSRTAAYQRHRRSGVMRAAERPSPPLLDTEPATRERAHRRGSRALPPRSSPAGFLARRCASMLLPEPGGPIMSRL